MQKMMTAVIGGFAAMLALMGSAKSSAQTPPPEYPTSARKIGAEGVTMLLLCVGTNGKAQVVGVSQSAGYAPLDDTAREWAEMSAFAPMTVDGNAVGFCGFEVAVEWSLGLGGSKKNGRSEAENVMRPFPELAQVQLDEFPSLLPGTSWPSIAPFEVKKSEAGVLTMDICIDTDGKVRTSGGFGSTGNADADLEIMARYFEQQYQPAMKNGAPVAVCGVTITYENAVRAVERASDGDASTD